MLETDLKTIERLAEEHWAENWNFRAYLKQHEAPARVDAVVHQLNAEIAPKIDCTACANCCKSISPYLTDADVERVAARLKLDASELVRLHLDPAIEDRHVFRSMPCPLLKGGRCGVYEDRPDDCASFPHLHKPDFVEYSISTIENYRVCPIIFNVYEALKTRFAFDPAVDYIGDVDQEAGEIGRDPKI